MERKIEPLSRPLGSSVFFSLPLMFEALKKSILLYPRMQQNWRYDPPPGLRSYRFSLWGSRPVFGPFTPLLSVHKGAVSCPGHPGGVGARNYEVADRK